MKNKHFLERQNEFYPTMQISRELNYEWKKNSCQHAGYKANWPDSSSVKIKTININFKVEDYETNLCQSGYKFHDHMI